jgi:outer membrane biosynthesis protein TonB
MKTPFRSVGLLLPLILTACFHKTEVVQNTPTAPAIVDTPLPTPPPPPSQVPGPDTTAQATQPPKQDTPPPKSAEKPAKHTSHHPKPETKNTEVASNAVAPAPEVSAVGQLSSGDPSDMRYETEQSIASVEHGLKDINRQLSDQEQKTANQVREFLKQAHTALSAGDVDGAHTLALKAKVLLNELAQ